jgi:hypothetical protein
LSLLSRTIDLFFKTFQPKQRDSFKIIFLCFAGATIFWFFNSLNKEYTTRINYPILFQFEKDSVVVMEELPRKIRLDVTSGGWNILRKSLGIDNNPVTIELDNPTSTKFLTGSFLLPSISDQINELIINYVVTDTLYFDIEEKLGKKVLIGLDSSGINLDRNHRIVSTCLVQPDTVWVMGPKSIMDTLAPTYTLRVLENEIDARYSRLVSIPLNSNPYLRTNPMEVEVGFDVEELLFMTKRIPAQLRNFPDSVLPYPVKNVEVAFWVRESMVNEPMDTLFQVVVDYNNLNWKDSTVIPRITRKPMFVDSVELVSFQLKL